MAQSRRIFRCSDCFFWPSSAAWWICISKELLSWCQAILSVPAELFLHSICNFCDSVGWWWIASLDNTCLVLSRSLCWHWFSKGMVNASSHFDSLITKYSNSAVLTWVWIGYDWWHSFKLHEIQSDCRSLWLENSRSKSWTTCASK